MTKEEYEDLRDLHKTLDTTIKRLMDMRKTFPIPHEENSEEFENQDQEDWKDRWNHSWDHRKYLQMQLENFDMLTEEFSDMMGMDIFCIRTIIDGYLRRLSKGG